MPVPAIFRASILTLITPSKNTIELLHLSLFMWLSRRRPHGLRPGAAARPTLSYYAWFACRSWAWDVLLWSLELFVLNAGMIMSLVVPTICAAAPRQQQVRQSASADPWVSLFCCRASYLRLSFVSLEDFATLWLLMPDGADPKWARPDPRFAPQGGACDPAEWDGGAPAPPLIPDFPCAASYSSKVIFLIKRFAPIDPGLRIRTRDFGNLGHISLQLLGLAIAVLWPRWYAQSGARYAAIIATGLGSMLGSHLSLVFTPADMLPLVAASFLSSHRRRAGCLYFMWKAITMHQVSLVEAWTNGRADHHHPCSQAGASLRHSACQDALSAQ